MVIAPCTNHSTVLATICTIMVKDDVSISMVKVFVTLPRYIINDLGLTNVWLHSRDTTLA